MSKMKTCIVYCGALHSLRGSTFISVRDHQVCIKSGSWNHQKIGDHSSTPLTSFAMTPSLAESCELTLAVWSDFMIFHVIFWSWDQGQGLQSKLIYNDLEPFTIQMHLPSRFPMVSHHFIRNLQVLKLDRSTNDLKQYRGQCNSTQPISSCIASLALYKGIRDHHKPNAPILPTFGLNVLYMQVIR